MSHRDARDTKAADKLMTPKRQTTPLMAPQVTAVLRVPRVTTRLVKRKKKSQ